MSYDGYNLGNAFGRIIISDNIDEALRNAQRSFDSGINNIGRSVSRLGDQFQRIGANLTLTLSPFTAFATSGILAFASFDDILTEIAARTGATADEMERVKSTALQMGQDTAFSATQAADAMLQLLSSGYDLDETFTALQPVLDLAAAGMLDLGYASDAVTDILAQFQLGAEDAGQVADALAQASGASSATIDQLIDGFANVGPLAYQFGLSVDDLAAILALFSENGIKGAEAGTQLKSMLTNMLRDTDDVEGMWNRLNVSLTDSDGNMRDLNEIIRDLNVSLADMTEIDRIRAVQTLAGSYGQMGMNILLGADGFGQMADAMDEQAVASDLAAARMDSFRGKTNQLRSSIETLSINVIGPLVDQYLAPLVVGLTEVINKVNEWLVANPELASVIGLVVAALAMLGPSLFVIGRIMSVFGSSITGVISIVRLFGAVVMAVFSPVGAVIAAAIALGVALYAAWESNFLGIRDTLLPVIQAVGNALGDLIEWFGGLVDVFQAEGLSGAFNYLVEGIGNLLSGIGEAVRNVDWLEVGASILRGIGEGITNVAEWVYNSVIVPLAEGVALYITSGQLWEDLKRLGQGILDGIREGIEGYITIQVWVWENLIVPLAEAVVQYIGSGQLFEDLKRLGEGIFNAIKEGIKSIDEIVTWVYANIILPAALAVRDYVKSGQLWEDLKRLGENIFNGIHEGIKAIGPIVEWVYNNIIKPAGDAIAQYIGSGQIWEDAKRLGESIVDGIVEGMKDLPGRIAGALTSGLGSIGNPASWGMNLAMDLSGHGSSPKNGNPEDAANAIIGNFGGLFSRDSGGSGMPGSIYRVGSGQVGQEFFGIGDAGHFYPDFAENLARIAGAVMAREMAAGGGGGGAEGRLSEQIIVNVTIPPGMLRDEAQLEENGRVFGRSVASEIRSRT